MPTDHSGTVFAAGGENHADYSDCPFRVDKYGNLYATSAEIKGKVTATSGSFTGSVYATSGTFKGTVKAGSVLSSGVSIGDWTISENGIYGSDANGNNVNLTPSGLTVGEGTGGGPTSWYSVFTAGKSFTELRDRVTALEKKVGL